MERSRLVEPVKSEFNNSLQNQPPLPELIYFKNIKQEDDISKVTSSANINEEYSVYDESISPQNDALIKIETNPPHYEELLDCFIKNEEVDIKEHLEESEASFSDRVVQQKINNFHDETSFETLSPRKKFPRSDHSNNNKKVSQINPQEIEAFKCRKCDFQTRYKASLHTHLLRHINPEEVQQFKCNQCSYKTIYKYSLCRHLLQHRNPEEVEKFKCNKCDFQTIHKRNIKAHMLQHENRDHVEKFKCIKCEYQTIYKKGLKRHLLRHKNPEELQMFKCDHCSFKTLFPFSLDRHNIRKHKNLEK